MRHCSLCKFDNKKELPEVFCKKGVLGNFTKFTGKYLRWSLFANSFQSEHMCAFFMLRHLTPLPFQPELFFNFYKSHTRVANVEYYKKTIKNNPNKVYIFEKVIK